MDLIELLPARLRSKIVPIGDCWWWVGAHRGDGYGYTYVGIGHANRRAVRAHKLIYELFCGPVPEGLELDHLCRERTCVHPGHLQAVTHAVNMSRGAWALRTHCPAGHLYDEANTRITPTGARRCRACHRQWERERRRAA